MMDVPDDELDSVRRCCSFSPSFLGVPSLEFCSAAVAAMSAKLPRLLLVGILKMSEWGCCFLRPRTELGFYR